MKKKQKPELLHKLENVQSFEEFMKLLNLDTVNDRPYAFNRNTIWDLSGNKLIPHEWEERSRVLDLQAAQHLTRREGIREFAEAKADVMYVEPETGNVWTSVITLLSDHSFMNARAALGNMYVMHAIEIFQITVEEFAYSEKLHCDMVPLQPIQELMEILQWLNPYAYRFVLDNDVLPEIYFQAPQLEILMKAGYLFAEKFLSPKSRYMDRTDIQRFNRLCRKGNSPKEIFKTSKAVYKALIKERDLQVWEAYRKMDKFGRIPAQEVRRSYESGITGKEAEQVSYILSQTYHGKPIFTFATLTRYLERLDMFEAIDKAEALDLLRDYLMMCRQLEIKPRVDADSLKREHDIAARLIRNRIDEKTAAAMQPICEKMSRWNYREGIYFIRAVTSYDDLIEEAKMQHNCVASYAPWIARQHSYIFVMRTVAEPNRSLITVELDPETMKIRQKLLAYNKHIRSSSQSEFLNRWEKYIRSIEAA